MDEPLMLVENQNDNRVVLNNKASIETETCTSSYGQTIKTLVLSTFPLTMTTAVSFFNQTITLHFLKSNSDIQVLGAYSLGGTIMNIVAMAIFISLNVGMTSKSAQAFGAKNYRLVGLYLHRGLIINMILFIPFCCFFYWSNHICMAFGFEENTSLYIQQYLSRAIPGLLATILFCTLTAYLNACKIFAVPGGIEIIGCVINWISNYILIEKYQMGLRGAAISWNIMFIVALVLLLAYIRFWNPVKETLFWFCRDSFRDIWSLFRHEALIGSMIYLQWIAFEIILVFAGGLSQVQLAALAIAFANLSLLYSVPLSIAEAVLTFIGNSVGEKNPEQGRRFLYAGVVVCLFAIVFTELFYLFFSRHIAKFYVDDQATQDLVVEYFHMIAFQIPPDFIQYILASGLRALGKEVSGTIFLLLCYYGISIPLSYFTCYNAGYQGKGLVFGPLINAYILLIGFLIIYKRLDWNKQVQIVNEKMKEEEGSDNIEGEVEVKVNVDFEQNKKK